MPKFRVSIQRVVKSGLPPNPFVPIQISMSARSRSLVRVWEFDAKDEAEVRRLFKEAQDQDAPYVRGFTMRSVEQIGP